MLPRKGIDGILSDFDEDVFYVEKAETTASGARPPICPFDSALSAKYVELERKKGLARPFELTD